MSQVSKNSEQPQLAPNSARYKWLLAVFVACSVLLSCLGYYSEPRNSSVTLKQGCPAAYSQEDALLADPATKEALNYSPLVSAQMDAFTLENKPSLAALLHVLDLPCDGLQLKKLELPSLIFSKELVLAREFLGPLATSKEGYTRPDYTWPDLGGDSVEAIMKQARMAISLQKREGIVKALEEALEKKFGAKYAVTFPTGTLALYASFIAADVQPGDEVIVPAYTFHGTWSALPSMGAILVPVDIYDENDEERIDGCVDPEKLVRAMTSNTKAIVVTHMWGLVCDVEEIERRIQELSHRLFVKNKVVIIEDSSHVHFGTSASGKYAGTLSERGLGAFSLNGPKPLSGGEGGFVLTNDEALYHRLVFSMHYNKRCKLEIPAENSLHKFCRTGWGLKARIHPLAAALALHQLQFVAPALVERRVEVARRMEMEFGKLESVTVPYFPRRNGNGSSSSSAAPSRYTFVLQYKPERFGYRVSREEFVDEVQRQATLSGSRALMDVDVPSMRPIVDHELYMSPTEVFPQYNTIEFNDRRVEILLESASLSRTCEGLLLLNSDYPEGRKFFDRAIKIPVWHFRSAGDRDEGDLADERTMLRYVGAFQRAEKAILDRVETVSVQAGASPSLSEGEACLPSSNGGKDPVSSQVVKAEASFREDGFSELSLVHELCPDRHESDNPALLRINKSLCRFFMDSAVSGILSAVVEKLRSELVAFQKAVEMLDQEVLKGQRDLSQEDHEALFLPFFEKAKQLMAKNFAEHDALFGARIFRGRYSFSQLLDNRRIPWLKALKVSLNAEAFASTLVVERGNAFSAIKFFRGKGVILQMHNFENPQLEDDPHCHKKHFFSGLLFGEYVHRVWRVKEASQEDLADVTLHECSKIDNKTRANPCRPLPGKQMEVLLEHRHNAGQVLFLHSKTLHTVKPTSAVGPISVVLRSGRDSTDTVYYQYFEDGKPGRPVSGPGGLDKQCAPSSNTSDHPRVQAFTKRRVLSGNDAREVVTDFFVKLGGSSS